MAVATMPISAVHAKGAILRLSPRPADIHAVDRTVAAIASQHDGKYSVDIHLRHDPAMSESGAQAHVRRLEAMRRSIGRPELLADGTWQVGPDHLADAPVHEQRQGLKAPVIIETLTHGPLDQLPAHDGETWLDRQLTAATPEPLQRGFGAEVRGAIQQRRQWLVEQQLAEGEEGVTRYRRNMLQLLQRRELDRVITGIEQDTGLVHRQLHADAPIEGLCRRAVQVGDQRYALIEKSREFSLVSWRPVLDRAVGKSVSGIMRAEGISWTIGIGTRGWASAERGSLGWPLAAPQSRCPSAAAGAILPSERIVAHEGVQEQPRGRIACCHCIECEKGRTIFVLSVFPP